MKIAIANDQYGYPYKQMLVEAFPEHVFVDCGTYDEDPVKYPLFGKKAAEEVATGNCERAILICGTGIGMCISANKVKGCYAAVCHDAYSAERSILSNNANILCMGALVIGRKTCEMITRKWLSLTFDETSHSQQNVCLVNEIEREQFK